MNGLICNAHIMLTSLYFFDKKENQTWGKDVLFDSMDDPTDGVVSISEFANINEVDAASALDNFVDKKQRLRVIFLIKVSIVCAISLRPFFD